MKRAAKNDLGPGAVDLIEEAVHLLRRHPEELAGYYSGAAPFAVTLLYFWSYITWFGPSDGAIAVGALALGVLFGVMKAGQHRFALRLLACRTGEVLPRWTLKQWWAETAVQLRLQAAGVVLVPLAALFAVPFGWVYAYYQNATVLPPDENGGSAVRRHQAWAQAQCWPVQNHWALTILSLLWFMVFLNVAVAFYVVPTMATQWLGLKTVFASSGWSYLNTTFLALVTVITHLLVDPLIKTFYLLRVFHGRSRQTGADLRLVLNRERQLTPRLAIGFFVFLLGVGLFAPTQARAEVPAPPVKGSVIKPSPGAPVVALDRALDRVLDQSDFRWRLRPLPAPPGDESEGIVQDFFRTSFKVIVQIVRSVVHWIGDVVDWFGGLFPGKKVQDNDDAAKTGARNSFNWMAALQLVSYLLLIAVVCLLAFVAWKVWQHNRRSVPLATGSLPASVGEPDLRDENVQASHLPAEGWLDLARQQMAVGEWRLALRALFLATLARLAHEGLVSLAKFKTNFDYEVELRRRAHSRTALVEDFRGRRRQYEEVWYGAMPTSSEHVRDWLQRMEGRT